MSRSVLLAENELAEEELPAEKLAEEELPAEDLAAEDLAAEGPAAGLLLACRRRLAARAASGWIQAD
ncbi:hypothetical protein NDS46_28620 [Paenibacillus thiaminolyticus]|uniref:hypothetical protein n=1 Tax=Paenibacillus thiaminolyticus TaxID=49283 RepID=UPI00232C878E|nr:hypothetical protein [Paenibacillus thiaminolyticus]WCF08173.1 hypothetical protein NDS46_28620 [Paenibacillus thiaminolyticus]